MSTPLIGSIANALNEIEESYRLNRETHVYHDRDSADFAKHYVKGHRGEYTPINVKMDPKHEKDAEDFENTYKADHVRTGFGGSGTSVYTHKQTGDKYEVVRRANGRGFHGTDHDIRKL